MTCYSVLAVTPTSEDWIPEYRAAAGEFIAKHGGKYLARTVSHERLEGEGEGEEVAFRLIVEWPSKQAALDFMSDPGYKPHLDARSAGSISHHILVEGKDDFA